MAWPWFLFEVEHGAGAREVTGGGWGGLEALSVGGGGVFCPSSEFMPVSGQGSSRTYPKLKQLATPMHLPRIRGPSTLDDKRIAWGSKRIRPLTKCRKS